MTDRTFQERREKVEFREALREFAESKTDAFALAEYEERVADELARDYWQDVGDADTPTHQGSYILTRLPQSSRIRPLVAWPRPGSFSEPGVPTCDLPRFLPRCFPPHF